MRFPEPIHVCNGETLVVNLKYILGPDGKMPGEFISAARESPMTPNIGCIAVLPCASGGFLGLNCAKGRGLILPGGKWEGEKETYHEAAQREAKEEVNQDCKSLVYLYQGPNGFGYTTFAFLGEIIQDLRNPLTTSSGKVQQVYWKDLFTSKYQAYYRVLYDVMAIHTSDKVKYICSRGR